MSVIHFDIMWNDASSQTSHRKIHNKMQKNKVVVNHKLGLRDLTFARAWSHNVHVAAQEQQHVSDKESRWSIIQHAREFCQHTSLHGLQYVGETGLHFFERLFWFGAFLLAMVTAALLINDLWVKWDQNPVTMSISTSSVPITDIPFPAITVCNMNNARRSVAESILNPSASYPGVNIERILLADACDNMTIQRKSQHQTTTPQTSGPDSPEEAPQWDAIQNFMIKVNEPCHELLLTCQWAGENRMCSELFNSVLTDEGLCCVFNRIPRDKLFKNPQDLPDLNITFPFPSFDWTPEKTYPVNSPSNLMPWRPAGAGKHLGLTIVLDVEVHEYYCSSTASAGLKMLLHSPVESPKMSSFGFAISPGKESFVAIQPEVTRSSRSIEKVPISKRHCFFLHERNLRFYRTYSKHNCARECEANYTLHRCGCVQYYMPKDKETKICGKSDDVCTEKAKSDVELHLYDESAGSRWEYASVRPSCHCLPGCNEITFSPKLTSSGLVDTFPGNKKYELENSRSPIDNITYFKNNVIVLHFFFMDMQVTTFEKTERIGFVDFLASTGGLLGLFHGFSVLSAIEVLYYLCLRLLCSWKRHRHVAPRQVPRLKIIAKHHKSFLN